MQDIIRHVLLNSLLSYKRQYTKTYGQIVLAGELFSTARGRVNVKDKFNNRFSVYVDDPRYKSGELIHVGRGMVCINNGVSNKKVEPSQLDSFLQDGWSVGRLKRKNMI